MQTIANDELVGKTVGTYRVERLLGRGRLSAVYLARHPVQDSTVALTTILLPEHFSSEARARFMARFTKEAFALTTLEHQHILPVYAYGEQYGYPYLVTPYMTHGSLADILKQQGRCTISYAQRVLEQVAAGLEYAHRKGVIHGALKPANILLSDEQNMLVAGFSLMHIVQMRGLEEEDPPNAHLLTIANTFLGAAEYLAPEVVQGQPVDARSDIYALGCILFELLSGEPPFSGGSPFDIALLHVQQPLPSLRKLCPDLPIALESVINHALTGNPAQRFQCASEFAEAFTQVYRGVAGPAVVHTLLKGSQASSKPATRTTEAWQILPPIVTGHLAAVKPPAAQQGTHLTDGVALLPQEDEPVARESIAGPTTVTVDRAAETTEPTESQSRSSEESLSSSMSGESVESVQALSERIEPAEAHLPAQEEAFPSVGNVGVPRLVSRRRVVTAALAASGAVIAGTLVVGGINLAHMMPSASNAQSTQGGKGARPHPTGKGKSASAPSKQPPGSQKQTGTVIGSSNLALNSSVDFTNPVDGKASLLIHLPDHRFVAYESACTHQGVTVHYDTATHTLVCPAHGSVFDPTNGGKVLQGPAMRPLPPVAIHVNANGTITVG